MSKPSVCLSPKQTKGLREPGGDKLRSKQIFAFYVIFAKPNLTTPTGKPKQTTIRNKVN